MQLSARGEPGAPALQSDTLRAPALYADVILGGYCALVAAALAWMGGAGSMRNLAVFLAFAVINGAIGAISRRARNPLSIEIARAAIGAGAVPLAHVLPDRPFDLWWPALLIMCIGGTVSLSLMTRSAVSGRVLSCYYVLLYLLSHRLTRDPPWHTVVVHAGALGTIGVLTSQMVALLGRALSAERERQAGHRALRQLNEELEARVGERTRELTATNHQLARQIQERERLTAILDTTTDLVATGTFDRRVTYMNRAGRRLLGFGEGDDPIGTAFSDLYTPESLELFEREGFPVALRQGSWSGEATLRARDGRLIPVSLVGNIHRGPDGAPASLSTIARDITERKRFEADLQAAKERAESASRAKSAFLATMSHEIRTPMNAIIGMAGLLLKTSVTPRQREFVETIRSSGDALVEVINDILDYSKIEAGKLGLERSPFDLRGCVESVLDLLAPRAAEKGLDLAYTLGKSVPEAVIGDITRVRQILVNLVSNAIKFTEQGEVVVSVTGRHPNGAGATTVDGGCEGSPLELQFAVTDTGIGITSAQTDRLFQSFSQLDASTTRKYGGTGLGLAISKRLAELMGGTMWVESEGVAGRGATFHFTIAALTSSAPISRSWSGPLPALRGRRVLIVDDNATNRRILSAQITEWGMLPVEARTPEEALEIAGAHLPVDLAILDMHMPGMDGLALARALCGRSHPPRLPFVLLSSLGRETGGDPESMACFAGYLTKPVKPAQLHDLLVAALADGSVRPSDAGEQPVRRPDDRLAERLPLRILLAEDLQVNQRLALLTLEGMGYAAAVANDGQDVLDALQHDVFDVVLMDVQMPTMDGLEATRRIRRASAAARQPYIIAMTANAMQGDREACLAAGMDDYVSKPVFEGQLRAALERAGTAVAARRGSDDAPARTAAATAPDGGIDAHTLARILRRSGSREIVGLFLAEARNAIHTLAASVAARDAQTLREAAHRIKGSSGYLGAVRLTAISAELERMGRLGDLDGAANALRALEQEFDSVAPRLTMLDPSLTLDLAGSGPAASNGS